jgi:protein-tyrosine-phosphatase
MLEWGDVPCCLERLVSEDWIVLRNDNDDDDDDDGISVATTTSTTTIVKLERTTITVMPEVGCGIDNLETIKKVDSYAIQEKQDGDRILLHQLQQHPPQSDSKNSNEENVRDFVVTMDRRTASSSSSLGKKYDLETIFQVADFHSSHDKDVDDAEEQSTTAVSSRRLRVSFSIDLTTTATTTTKQHHPSLSQQITIHTEHLLSPTSTKGTAWTGPSHNSGGLDARSVMNDIGKDIVYGDVFAVKRGKMGMDRWSIVNEDGRVGVWGGVSVEEMLDGFGCGKDDGVESVRLAQNILIRCGYGLLSSSSDDGEEGVEKDTLWGVEVSHFDYPGNDNEGLLRRRVVLRTFDEEEEDGMGTIHFSEQTTA